MNFLKKFCYKVSIWYSIKTKSPIKLEQYMEKLKKRLYTQTTFKKCFHPYTTLHRNIDCKYYIDGKCTYTERDGCGYIYEELKKGVANKG